MWDSQTNTFTKGMNLDTAKEYIDHSLYISATDVHVTGDGNSYGTLLEYDEIYEYVKQATLGIVKLYKILGVTRGKKYHNSSVVECVIVFSVDTTHGQIKKKNKLQVFTLPGDVDKAEDFKLESIFTLEYEFDINSAVKLINVYENEKVSRVYIAAENKHIHVVNINKTYTPENINDFSIFPKCGLLKPFVFDDETSGSLTAGKYLYAYQLFNEDGQTSALSIISHSILVGSELSGDITDKGVILKLDTSSIVGNWERIRIYSIVYVDSVNVPQVYTKAEIEFTNADEFYWSDLDDGFINTLTLEEFNAIKNTVFAASTIETKDNILFAAGILFDDFDVDFDARAYPASSGGWVGFKRAKNTLLIKLTDIKSGHEVIDDEDDCLIPDTDVYKYNTLHGKVSPYFAQSGLTSGNQQYPLGGAGPNVEYMFEHPVWYLSPFSARASVVEDNLLRYISTNVTEKNLFTKGGNKIDSVRILYPNKGLENWGYLPDTSVKCSHKIENLNHADTYLCANYTGFKQGEVYRFGIVFYNNRMQRSPVHWISDITIPRSEQWIFSGIPENDSSGMKWSHDLVATGVGITFKVNLPDSIKSQIVGYEIVRCDRTMTDRTILCQGVCSRTLSYQGRGTNNTKPFVASCIPSMNALLSVQNDDGDDFGSNRALLYERLLTFVSPEISSSKEGIEQHTKNIKYFRPVSDLSSYTSDTERDLVSKDSRFKYMRLGTSPTSYKDDNGDYDDEGYFGMIRITGVGLTFVMHSPNKSRSTLGVFKFYQPCNNYGSSNYYKIEPSSVKYVDGLDFNTYDADITTKSIAVGNHLFCNLGLSNNDDAEGEGSHGPCLVLEFTKDDSQNYIIRHSPQDNSDHMIHNWSTNWRFPQTSEFLYQQRSPVLNATTGVSSIAGITGNSYIYGDEDNDNDYTDIRELPGVTLSSSSAGTKIISRLSNSIVLADLYTKNTPYNGHTYSARVNSTYVSTGLFFEVSSGEEYCSCYGGDTYVVLNEALWQQYNIGSDNRLSYHDKAVIVVKYPVETSVNVYRAAGPKYSDNPNTIGHFFEPTVAGQFSLDKPYAAYNDAYSSHETARIHVQKGMWDISNQYIPNRIMNSETKSVGELTDSFLVFKVANYIDVDNNFGKVTNLVNFNNNLVFFQDNATGLLSVNERSIIKDNLSTLLLGTGGILTAFTYYSSFYGTSIINDTSIVKAPAALYWYDNIKQNIYVLNNQIEPLSLVKSVQSYLTDFKTNHNLNLVHPKMFSAYDSHNREVWFRLEPDDKALIYSELLGQFVSFYSRPIQHSVTMSDNTVSFIDGNCLSIGKNYKNVEYSKGNPSITFVVNKNVNIPKVFDAVQTSSSNSTGEVFCEYTFKTNRQESSSVAQNNANRFVEGVCYTYIPRDKNKERLRDRYMTVTMDFNNGNKFYIPNVNTIFRKSLH